MSRRTVGLFVAMSIIWGTPYLLIKVAVREFPPVSLVFVRTAIGGLSLLPVAAVRGELRPVLRRWRAVAAYTVAEVAVPFVLLPRAEERLSSSLTGLLVAAVPLVGVGVAWSSRSGADIGRVALAGLGIGLLGVGVLLGVGPTPDLGDVGLVGIVALGYALGPAIVARALPGVPGLGLGAVSLLACAVVYAPLGLSGLPVHPSLTTVAAVVGLGVGCTALAFVLYFALIDRVGPIRATLITYFNPVVAVALGVAVLGEQVKASAAVGLLLILAGSVLATRRRGVGRRRCGRHSRAPITPQHKR